MDRGPGDCELLPYLSLPVSYTQPARLAALAALFRLDAPDPATARVLELGCAGGGNLIPLAARFPNARFTGIDISRRHIEDGGRRIGALSLANVALRLGDIAEVALEGEVFDYIICHGVFSWVPAPAREAILRICGTSLAPQGVAVISYNVLPGWHLRKVVRDLCLFHAGKDGSPWQRAAAAREVIEQVAAAVGDTEPYGLLLRNEAKRIVTMPSSYIAGEFLAPENAPCHVHEFIEGAASHGLDYLCEADLGASIARMLNGHGERSIRTLAGASRIAAEQYTDFFSGRAFRRSLLIKAGRRGGAPPGPRADRIGSLHLSSSSAMKTGDPAVDEALGRLVRRYPASATLAELGSPAGLRSEVLSRTVLGMIVSGRAGISVAPLQVGRADDERPALWPVARAEAAAGQRWLTSLQHSAVPLRGVPSELLAHLDGSTRRDELDAALGAPNVERALRYLAANALLAPQP